MARSKKGKKKVGHRRRRHKVGALPPALAQTGMLLAGGAAGAIVATFANQAIKGAFTTMPPAAVGIGIAAVGAVLPMFLKPNPMIMGLAAGMAGMGIVFAANESFMSLPGISGVPAGLPMARPGFMNKTVGNAYSRMPQRTVGNFSGNTRSSVGAILFN